MQLSLVVSKLTISTFYTNRVRPTNRFYLKLSITWFNYIGDQNPSFFAFEIFHLYQKQKFPSWLLFQKKNWSSNLPISHAWNAWKCDSYISPNYLIKSNNLQLLKLKGDPLKRDDFEKSERIQKHTGHGWKFCVSAQSFIF